ncbi:hypothetical protein DXV75_13915 [Alteromonas aestuariivivens]|uniref:LPXTG cell wall anchor domain-containing protein n=1 Tax=Alteromonas aestuariivivens TaxID=1938339 RepID=A0A3D8M4Q6_9ALTE|nr:hypothetical protein [Alteromonas aestuariivivens]RDV24514.1 hypothetical protein DXV75_13915 [Alteromonas aestuariivivens]
MKGLFKKLSMGMVVWLSMLSWNANAQVDCGDVEYNSEVLENYPELANACQGVVAHNGKLYTKVYARIGYKDSMDRRSVRLVMSDGSLGPRHRIRQRPNFSVTTYDGDKIDWADLAPDQDITVYIPNDRWAIVHVDMDEAEEEVAEVVEYTMVAVEEELPTTASNRYLTLYLGLAALMLASLMWMRRKSLGH